MKEKAIWIIFIFLGTVIAQTVPCEQDPYETNNNRANATLFTFVDAEIYVENATLCEQNDTDWYRIVVPSDGHIDIQIVWNVGSSADDYPGGRLILNFLNVSSNVTTLYVGQYVDAIGCQIDVTAGSIFLLQILPALVGTTTTRDVLTLGSYSFLVQMRPGPTCRSDVYEPNNNILTSTRVPATGFSYHNLSSCKSDQDWFNFTVYEDTDVTASVAYFDQLLSDLDLYIYLSDGSTEVDSATTVDNPEVLTTHLVVGQYFLKVVQYDIPRVNWSISSYDLNITTGPGPTITTSSSSLIPPTMGTSTMAPSIMATSTMAPQAIATASSSGSNVVGVALGSVAAILFVAIVGVIVGFFLVKRYLLKNNGRRHNLEEPHVQMVQISPVHTPGPSAQTLERPASQIPTVPMVQVEIKMNKNFIIDHNQLEELTAIGRGSFGIVYRGKWRETVVAVKQLLGDFEMDEKAMADFSGEANLLAQLRPHPNVVLFMGITAPPQPLTIVTEFCSGGSLWSIISSSANISPEMQKKWLLGIARGIFHLHSENIIHRDLACRNVLLNDSLEPKVADFGLSRHSQNTGDSNKTKSGVGPLKWMPPEAIRDKIYSTQSDVWSFGVVIWEITNRNEPFPDMDAVKAAMGVCYEDLRLVPSPNCDPVLSNLMTACFHKDPSKRPTMKELCTVLVKEVPMGNMGFQDSMLGSDGKFPSAQGGSSGNRQGGSSGKSFADTAYGVMDLSQLSKDGNQGQPMGDAKSTANQAPSKPDAPSPAPSGTYDSIHSALAYRK